VNEQTCDIKYYRQCEELTISCKKEYFHFTKWDFMCWKEIMFSLTHVEVYVCWMHIMFLLSHVKCVAKK